MVVSNYNWKKTDRLSPLPFPVTLLSSAREQYTPGRCDEYECIVTKVLANLYVNLYIQ